MYDISLDYQVLPAMVALALFGLTILGISGVSDKVCRLRNSWKSYRRNKRITA